MFVHSWANSLKLRILSAIEEPGYPKFRDLCDTDSDYDYGEDNGDECDESFFGYDDGKTIDPGHYKKTLPQFLINRK